MNITLESSFEFLTNEAIASIGLNPFFRWAKFVLTDDDVNLNNQKVPQEEFDNIISTGIYTPIKMDFGRISEGHKTAERKPIGVITHIKKDVLDGRNVLVALAALWKKERPDDVDLLKEMVDSGEPPKVSWEISYHDSEFDGKAEILKGTILTGVAIVANPAYADRTRFLAVAELEETESEKWTREYINNLPDSAFLYIEPGGEKDEEGKTKPRSLRHLPYKDMDGNIDVEHLRNAIVRLSQENTGKDWLTADLRERLLNKARKLLESYNKEEKSEMELEQALERIKELESKLSEYETKTSEMMAELEALREYKNSVEAEKKAQERISQIKQMFLDKGIEKPDSYFEENKELFLNLTDSAVEFMIQELVAFAEKMKDKKDATSSLPNINQYEEGTKPKSVKELAEQLRKLSK